jgi:hypothetical protein
LECFRDDQANHPAVIDGQNFVAHGERQFFRLLKLSVRGLISLATGKYVPGLSTT